MKRHSIVVFVSPWKFSSSLIRLIFTRVHLNLSPDFVYWTHCRKSYGEKYRSREQLWPANYSDCLYIRLIRFLKLSCGSNII